MGICVDIFGTFQKKKVTTTVNTERRDILEFNCNVRIVDAVMGRGKAQPIDSLVLTKKGFEKMGTVKVDSFVYGDDGYLHKVIGIYQQGVKSVYKITFSDGTSTLCCKEHLWTYQKPQDKAKHIYRTNTLEDIMKMELYKQTNRGDKNWQFFIPITKPVHFNNYNTKLPIHPYVLGVLLGDGCFNKKGSVLLTNPEVDITDKVDKLIGEDFILNKINLSDLSHCDSFIIVDSKKKATTTNRFKDILRSLGLLGKMSYEKFIPDIYKYSNIENRTEILRGLIDTDGSINVNNYEFSTSSKTLANDVVFIVQSLGGTATITEHTAHYSYKGEYKTGHISYRLYIKMNNDIKICSSNKHLEKIGKARTNPIRSIRKIEYEKETECQCILIDSESHLYLTNDFIVTHNTSASINYMDKASLDEKFLVITPYLTEITRYQSQCPKRKFKQPVYNNCRKIDSLKNLVNREENIIATHALFQKFDNELIDMCRAKNYTLIMDEVANVVEAYQISKSDIEILMRDFVHIDDDTNQIKWNEDKKDYYGEFSDVKRLCELGSLGFYSGAIMMWLFPVESFNAFRNIYILTYMFHSQMQRYYYDYYGLPYKYIYISGNNIENFSFSETEEEYESDVDYKSLINIISNEKLNLIGDRETDLSKAWFDRNLNNVVMKQLKNNISNFFRHIRPDNSNDNLWTTFKDYKKNLQGKGYTKGFLSINMRATNEYRDRTSVAYVANRYMNPVIKNFFSKHNVAIDEDGFALSEMLQFIWRSAIRDKKEIYLYIPSVRMRNLLTQWISQNSPK